MAKGKTCPECKHSMFAVSETDEPKGSWVVYECRSVQCKFREKVFEPK